MSPDTSDVASVNKNSRQGLGAVFLDLHSQRDAIIGQECNICEISRKKTEVLSIRIYYVVVPHNVKGRRALRIWVVCLRRRTAVSVRTAVSGIRELKKTTSRPPIWSTYASSWVIQHSGWFRPDIMYKKRGRYY